MSIQSGSTVNTASAFSNYVQATNAVNIASEETEDLFGPAKRQRGDPDNDEGMQPKKQKVDTQQMLDEYFGQDDELTEEDLFLKRFIAEKVQLDYSPMLPFLPIAFRIYHFFGLHDKVHSALLKILKVVQMVCIVLPMKPVTDYESLQESILLLPCYGLRSVIRNFH